MKPSLFKLNAAILSAATVVGEKEHEGPLSAHFDFFNNNDRFGQKPGRPPNPKCNAWLCRPP